MRKQLLLFLITTLFTGLTASVQSWLWGAQGYEGLKRGVVNAANCVFRIMML
jgi:hypothetical protein